LRWEGGRDAEGGPAWNRAARDRTELRRPSVYQQ
jgi:hypothetical protein